MITHYLPQFLLQKFRSDRLFEMEIESGMIRSRSLLKAGSDDDLWPSEIEKGMMEAHDNAAARILGGKVWGRHLIKLTSAERESLAQWLALFLIRVPVVSEVIRNKLMAPDRAVRVIMRHPQEVLRLIRAGDPELYERTIADRGQAEGEKFLLADMAGRIERGDIPIDPDPAAAHHTLLAEAEAELGSMAKRLAAMQWIWYRSSSGFCIGDNPLCRWHLKTDRPVWNIPPQNVELTFPVSTELTLLIGAKRKNDGEIISCNRKRSRHFNHRQRFSALSLVYAGSAELLNPQARYGYDTELPPVFREREFQLPEEEG